VSRAALSALALAVVVVSGCGGAGSTSPASLKSKLVPPSQLEGFKLHRSFEWDNSVDFAVQGLPLPESTPPSTAVDVVDKAGFDAAAGEQLRNGAEVELWFVVVKLGSDRDAEELSSFAYAEGLKQPCFGVCSEEPGPIQVSGIPGAKGVQQVPAKVPPPGAPPGFTAYGIGFTVGPYFYLVTEGGPPGLVQKQLVIDAARRLYGRVK
jgi:hypothetical protein